MLEQFRTCYEVYCDASFCELDNTAGYGLVIINRNTKEIVEKSGKLRSLKSNNHAEVMAVLKSLQKVEKDVAIIIFTDSKYVWQRFYWSRKKKKKAIQEKEIWNTIFTIMKQKKQIVDVSWRRRDNEYIRKADRLARQARK